MIDLITLTKNSGDKEGYKTPSDTWTEEQKREWMNNKEFTIQRTMPGSFEAEAKNKEEIATVRETAQKANHITTTKPNSFDPNTPTIYTLRIEASDEI